MKYKYIGTEEQLIEYGFEIDGQDLRFKCAVKNRNHVDRLYISLGRLAIGETNIITFDDMNRDDEDITPYIQDLIDANLVEVSA